ncbi:acetate--CoA ligase family protein [Patescibacteria group bacterium]|nr:acetate--CoA ligase family protein [Patescibacteria group bacterium]
MKGFFYPKSVAVFGVSPKYDNWGRNIVKNLIDFDYQGKIFPIGTSEGAVYGMTIRQSVQEIEDDIDLVIFLIPASAIPENLRACGEKGIKRVVISTGGFSEFSAERRKIEDEIVAILKEYGMRLIGPNGIGVINNEVGLCLPFVRLRRFPMGPVSLMTQSGGMGLSFIKLLTADNIGLNKYVSLGNKLDICEAELVPFLEEDEKTEIICMYLEEICRGQEFMAMMRKVKKPVLVYKTNVTEQSRSIAQSHTASIANDDRVVDAALRQAHVIRVGDTKGMITAAKALKLPPMRGNRVAVMTPTGGYAVILADECGKRGFVLPPFPDEFIDDIKQHVRAGVISMSNPLDLGDLFDMEMLALTITRAMQEENFDALVLGWMMMQDSGMAMSGAFNVFPFLEKMVKDYNKPVSLCLVGDPSDLEKIKRHTKLPIFDSPEEAVEALGVLYQYTKWSGEGIGEPEIFSFDKKRVDEIISASKKELGFMGAMEVLKLLDIPAAEVRRAANADEAAKAAEEMGYPVAVKVLSAEASHKSDVGGVKLGLKSADEVRAAAAEMLKAVGGAEGVVVQKMAAAGREVIVGAKRNNEFGPVVAFGLGGIMVEAMEDVALRGAPLSRRDAEEMLGEIRGAKVLGEFRGQPAADRGALVDIILRVSSLMTACPEIQELDINPVMVYGEGEGCVAVDARIILAE